MTKQIENTIEQSVLKIWSEREQTSVAIPESLIIQVLLIQIRDQFNTDRRSTRLATRKAIENACQGLDSKGAA